MKVISGVQNSATASYFFRSSWNERTTYGMIIIITVASGFKTFFLKGN